MARRTGWCIAAIFTACCVEAFNARAPGRLHLDCRCVGFDEDDGGIRLQSRQWRDASRRRRGRRRRRALRNPPADRRRRQAVLRGRRGLARPGADGAAAADHAARCRHQLGRARRPRHHLSGSPRRAAELRRHLRRRELAGGVLDRARHARGLQPIFAGWNPDIHTIIENIDVPYKWALLGRDPLRSLRHGPRLRDRRCRASDAAVPGAGRQHGDRGRHGAGALPRDVSSRRRRCSAISARGSSAPIRS